MNIENSSAPKLKCPCCPIETEDITRLKDHLIRCRKGIDKTVYLCKFYFGHLFQTREESEMHEETCIYKERPIRYPEHKRKMILNKDNQYLIENENFPLKIEERVRNTVNIENISEKFDVYQSPKTQNEKIQPEKEQAIFSYNLHDLVHNTKTMLTYSTGLSFSIGDFYIQKYVKLSDYMEFFHESKFGREQFEKYATTFNYVFDPNPKLEAHFEGDRIGFNDSKVNYNEILIIASKSNSILSKFFIQDFAILVVPATLLLDIPQPVTSSNIQSYYRTADFDLQIVSNYIEKSYQDEEKVDYGAKLCESLINSNAEQTIRVIDDIDSTPLTINQLNELVKRVEKILEMEKKGKEKLKEDIDNDYEKLKSDVDGVRESVSKRIKNFASIEQAHANTKSSFQLKMKDLRSRFDKSLADKKYYIDMRSLLKKTELDRNLTEKEERVNVLKSELYALYQEENQGILNSEIEAKKFELEELKRRLAEKLIEREKVIEDEKKIFEESNLTQGLKFEDFTCIFCKSNRREIIFFPCRHFISCLSCAKAKAERNDNKCKICSHQISEHKEVEFVKYTIEM